MKARMLWVAVLFTLTTQTAQAEKIDFHGLIEAGTDAAEKTNQEVIKSLPQAETVGFYQTDWLRLRQRKRFAVAKLDVKLKVNSVDAKRPTVRR
jgi:hypothetical protein